MQEIKEIHTNSRNPDDSGNLEKFKYIREFGEDVKGFQRIQKNLVEYKRILNSLI